VNNDDRIPFVGHEAFTFRKTSFGLGLGLELYYLWLLQINFFTWLSWNPICQLTPSPRLGILGLVRPKSS